jgi:threonine dehydratase
MSALGAALDCELNLKLETDNPIRCFKGRGTETAMARLADSPNFKAAVCASAGNLGQALAYSGQRRGISTTVVASSGAKPYKLERIRALGATVRIVDGDIEDARDLARQIAESEGAFLVEDSENLDTCEGAGTIGIELVEGVSPLGAVLVALGGGAMATGVGYVFKCLASGLGLSEDNLLRHHT